MTRSPTRVFKNWKTALLGLVLIEGLVLGILWARYDFDVPTLLMIGGMLFIFWGYVAWVSYAEGSKGELGGHDGSGGLS